MSICVYGRIKRKCINEDLLERFLADFFCLKGILPKNNEKCVIHEGISNKNKVSISFISEKKPPYNIYDSDLVNGEFEYIQLIIFEIEKEKATIDNYRELINFCFYLKERIDSDILVTSDVHNDICLLEGTEVIWSKDVSFG